MQLCSEGAPAGALISCEQAAYSCTVLPAPPQARFPWERADVRRTRKTSCPWCVKAGFLRGYVEAHGHSRAHAMREQRGSSSGALRAWHEAPGSKTINQWLCLRVNPLLNPSRNDTQTCLLWLLLPLMFYSPTPCVRTGHRQRGALQGGTERGSKLAKMEMACKKPFPQSSC